MAYRKYHNKPVVIDGHRFPSIREANRYRQLRLMERAGAISDLQMQVKYVLIPAQYADVPTGERYKSGPNKGMPKFRRECLEKECSYYADFVYKENGVEVAEDTKGFRTKEYIIKRKLLLFLKNIRIREV